MDKIEFTEVHTKQIKRSWKNNYTINKAYVSFSKKYPDFCSKSTFIKKAHLLGLTKENLLKRKDGVAKQGTNLCNFKKNIAIETRTVSSEMLNYMITEEKYHSENENYFISETGKEYPIIECNADHVVPYAITKCTKKNNIQLISVVEHNYKSKLDNIELEVMNSRDTLTKGQMKTVKIIEELFPFFKNELENFVSSIGDYTEWQGIGQKLIVAMRNNKC